MSGTNSEVLQDLSDSWRHRSGEADSSGGGAEVTAPPRTAESPDPAPVEQQGPSVTSTTTTDEETPSPAKATRQRRQSPSE